MSVRAVALTSALVLGGATASWGAPAARVELTFTDPEIVESSGLVASDDLVVTVNDSGDSGRVFVVDRASGDTVGVTSWADDPVDVEALAPAVQAGEVWAADIGDNDRVRESVSVRRVPVGRGDRSTDAVSYELVYPDGPQDAETLMVHPQTGRLVVVTKGLFGGQVLVAPKRLDPDRPNRLRLVGSARAIATDGAFWPDGRHVVVRGYGTATVYTWPGLETVARLDLPEQQQGEGIAVDPSGVVLVSSEGAGSDVLRVRLPGVVRRAVAPPPEPTASQPPSPGTPAGSDGSEGTQADTYEAASERSAWPFVVGGVVGLVGLLVLVRSLRPRG